MFSVSHLERVGEPLAPLPHCGMPDPGIGSTRTPLIRAPELAGTGVKPSTVIGISLGSER